MSLVPVFVAMLLQAVAARTAPAGAQAEVALLVDRARAHQAETARAARAYSFVQHELLEVRAPSGEMKRREERRLRVVPVDGGLLTTLLEVDGRPPTAKELARNDEHNQGVQARAQRRAARPAGQADDAKAETDVAADLLELVARSGCEVVGRREVDGRRLVGLAFGPAPEASGDSVARKLMQHGRGTVWIDEETAQPVRAEADAADDFRVKGVVGVKGFSFRAEQVRVNDEIWLPARLTLKADVSMLGLRRSILSDVTISDYRKGEVAGEAGAGEPLPDAPRPSPARSP